MTSTLDQLILDVAAAEAPGAASVAILDDPAATLLRSALDTAERVWVASRTVMQAREADLMARELGARDRVRIAGADGPLRLDEFFTEKIDVALGHTPKSLEEVAYLAGSVPAGALIFGANNKHMDRGHNATLARYFTDVHASRGRGKFRCLVGAGRTGQGYEPASRETEAGTIVGVGGVFSGAEVDHGGQLLADTALAELRAERRKAKLAANPWDSWEAPSEVDTGRSVVDLGCGNGTVARIVLATLPDATVLATDADADAVVSASLTLAEFGDRARVTWDDAAGQEPTGSSDVVLLNPPFHAGTALDATLVQDLLDAAARLLRPGGRLYMVHNNHLRYRPEVERRVGRTRQLARNAKFTVLRADVPFGSQV